MVISSRRGLVPVGGSTARARTAKVVISQTMRLAARHGAVAYNPVREVARIDNEPAKPPAR